MESYKNNRNITYLSHNVCKDKKYTHKNINVIHGIIYKNINVLEINPVL